MNRQKNIERFENLMANVKREGMDKLMDYIRNETDFYTAPASSRFHLSCEGGLLQHSLNVYDLLASKANMSPTWASIIADAGEDAQILCPLLHDLCKTNFYIVDYKNQKTYDPEKVKRADRFQIKHDNNGHFIWETVPIYAIKDQLPYGHGEKSVMLIEQFIKLTEQERFAIRWHMGFSEDKSMHQVLKQAMEKYPFILALNEADNEAAILWENTDGNKLVKTESDFEEAESI